MFNIDVQTVLIFLGDGGIQYKVFSFGGGVRTWGVGHDVNPSGPYIWRHGIQYKAFPFGGGLRTWGVG